MIERNDKDEFVRIRCDECNKPAPPSPDILINRGLVNMGWHCLGGHHLCPQHVPTGASANAPSDN